MLPKNPVDQDDDDDDDDDDDEPYFSLSPQLPIDLRPVSHVGTRP